MSGNGKITSCRGIKNRNMDEFVADWVREKRDRKSVRS
jgi:hypothetical protein